MCSGKRNTKRRPKPVSDKQLRYLRNLSGAFGEKPPEVKTAQEAHLAISALKRKLETAKRMGGAARAGIKGPLVG